MYLQFFLNISERLLWYFFFFFIFIKGIFSLYFRDNKQGTGGELVEEFAVVIKALWMGQYKSFYPRDFKVCQF